MQDQQTLAQTECVGEVKRYFVHVYATIRIKVAIDAQDHRAAMEAADAVAFGESQAVRLTPDHPAVMDTDFADEVTEYLVDEDGDSTFSRSRSYGPHFAPIVHSGERKAA